MTCGRCQEGQTGASSPQPPSAPSAPVVVKSGRKKTEDDKPKGVELAPSQWTDDIVGETNRYNGNPFVVSKTSYWPNKASMTPCSFSSSNRDQSVQP